MMNTVSRLSIAGIAALVLAGCSTAPPQSAQTPTVNVTGDWQGEWKCDRADAAGIGIVVLTLTQTGAAVAGHSAVTNSAQNRTGNVEGRVSGSEFSISGRDLSVNTNVSGDKMAGTFKSGICTGTLALNREPFQGTAQRNRLTTIAATVEAIDHGNRIVTLRGPQGNSLTFQVDPRVPNLQQVSVGDVVVVAYYQSWALSVGKSGSPAIIQSTRTAQTPGTYAARMRTIPATVEAIDGGKPSVTFKGPEGRSVEVMVADDPRILGQLKVGETYDVAYTEAVAVRVD